MILFKKSAELRKWLENQHKNQRSVGFVPTMGALHAGHLSLVDSARKNNAVTVCSIFVNPTQFNDKKDFDKYPITLEKDISMLLEAETDILFLPDVNEIYGNADRPQEYYELGYLETVLEGSSRPGHFQGVCMVVRRLLEIVQPDTLYLGQKDYQQCLVIKKLVGMINQDKINIQVSPTFREPDGLAMSSRNMRLTESERKKAPFIYKTLEFIKKNIRPGDLTQLKTEAATLLEKEGFKVDYAELADAETLELKESWDGNKKLVALVAAFLNEIRLIDNLIID
jgi:pantoate--beta-alanine ligase